MASETSKIRVQLGKDDHQKFRQTTGANYREPNTESSSNREPNKRVHQV